MKNQANPQGKGMVPVLDSLASSRTLIAVPPKQIQQISAELFTSIFVLQSEFKFKPVMGKTYWLYRKQGVFRLSLISPAEWGHTAFGQFVGHCELHPDLTWTLQLDTAAARDTELLDVIESRRQQFEEKLQNAETIDQVLPVFDASLPFYQRVFASALAHSLGISMRKSGIKGLSYQQARGLLV